MSANGTTEAINKPKSMLLNSDFTRVGIILLLLTGKSLLLLFARNILNPRITAPIPRMAEMLKMFEPKAFPIDNAAPPDNAALNATVNSGSVVDSAINVKPIEVFPSLLIAAIFVAYLITMSLAKFRNIRATAMIIRFIMKSMLNKSAISCSPPLLLP